MLTRDQMTERIPRAPTFLHGPKKHPTSTLRTQITCLCNKRNGYSLLEYKRRDMDRTPFPRPTMKKVQKDWKKPSVERLMPRNRKLI
jgi:hypothetical protein